MKNLALTFLIAATAYAGPITQKPLDEFVIYDIPVASKSGTTTIMFPSEISGLYAKSVAIQEQENAGFLISFTPGNFYFSIRALKPDAEDHLTVIFNRKAYVLHLKASDRPFYNVTFYQDQRTGKDGGRVAVVPERLLSLMDKAKASVTEEQRSQRPKVQARLLPLFRACPGVSEQELKRDCG